MVSHARAVDRHAAQQLATVLGVLEQLAVQVVSPTNDARVIAPGEKMREYSHG